MSSASPISGRAADVLVDASAAIALMVPDHRSHDSTFQALGRRRLGLAGHAAFETYSVLTRLPAPARLTPAAVARVLLSNFPGTRYLSAAGTEALVGRLVEARITGGAVYDALVGAAAAEHGQPLATRDRRAADTYRAVGVEVELLAD